jgi:hypothetical protein
MPIDTQHKDYAARLTEWRMLRDCIAGQGAVVAAGTAYVPQLSGQLKADYDAYLKRGLFFGATGRTLDGLTGMIFRKPPQLDAPDALARLLEEMTPDGLPLLGLAERITAEVVGVGRCGVLVDYPALDTGAMSRLEFDALAPRPYAALYMAEDIFNWRLEQDAAGTRNILTQVRLYERAVEYKGLDEEEVLQIRLLFLDGGVYKQQVYRQNKDRQWEPWGAEIVPVQNGAALDYIPFTFFGPQDTGPAIQKPPMLDLAHANISHFQTTVDYEHGAHLTGLPTAVICAPMAAPDVATAARKIGSGEIWQFDDPQAKAFYLEYTGQGLGALEARLKAKEEYMASLGARMLTPERRAVEAAETAAIHRQGETSVLASIAGAVSDGLTQVIERLAAWAGIEQPATYTLNHDFNPAEMGPQELLALVQAWQAGAIAFTDLFQNLQRGEIIGPDRTPEDVQAEAEQQDPFAGAMVAANANS